MKENIKKFLAAYELEISEAGKKLEHTVMPKLTEELFSEFERTGNRITYERVYFMRRKFLSVYALLSVLYAREHDIKKLESIIGDICEEECWALPAHVNRKDDKDWRITLDLFSAETAFSLAEITGRLKGKLSEAVCIRVRDEVFRRVLIPFMESTKPAAWWETSHMNWCAVCNGSIGGAAIWLMEDKARLELLLNRVCSSIINYMDGFGEDGACLEGLGYYTYGMSFFAAFADLVYEYSGGRICLTDSDKFRKMALFQQKCFLPGRISLSFSDCSMDERFRVGLTSYLSMLCEDVEFPDFEMAAGLETDECYRYVILSRDILFARRYLEQNPKERRHSRDRHDCAPYQWHTVLPDAQWSICRSKNGCVLAAKGGDNEEPHNHNDVGSFMFASEGEIILADLGAGEYTRDYFHENRYKNLCCRSLGHNVPVIDGREQQSGEECRASRFEADGNGNTVIGMERAYGMRQEKMTRAITFHPENGNCKIMDEFLLREGRVVTENLVSIHKPELVQESFYINAGNIRFRIECRGGSGHRILQEEYTDHSGNRKQVWLMQWELSGNRAEICMEKI